jgi:hypothetical protein
MIMMMMMMIMAVIADSRQQTVDGKQQTNLKVKAPAPSRLLCLPDLPEKRAAGQESLVPAWVDVPLAYLCGPKTPTAVL